MASDSTSNSRASVQSESSPITESAAWSIAEPSVPSLHQCLTLLASQVKQLRASQTQKAKMPLEENWHYRCYKELALWIPELMRWIGGTEDMNELDNIIKKLTKGADSARSDDACHMKSAVIGWIGESTPLHPRLYPHDKFGRGFQNDTTARLLCPVKYDWDCAEHRNKIWDWHPDFLVTANSWLCFLYKNNHYDSSKPAKGLFKGTILLKVCYAMLQNILE
ncbi:hypothetical protein J3R83DRAFT_3973 [Lanmaoa asiatica]|nr:hypothetical protein J3R83DRAFT_3973 [Lanmaoa asiatica]